MLIASSCDMTVIVTPQSELERLTKQEPEVKGFYQALIREIAMLGGDISVVVSRPPSYKAKLEALGMTNEQFLASPLSVSFAKAQISKNSINNPKFITMLNGVIHPLNCNIYCYLSREFWISRAAQPLTANAQTKNQNEVKLTYK